MGEIKKHRGAFFPTEMITSKPFWSLSKTSVGMLALLLERKGRFNRNQITFTYLELENLFGDGDGLSRASVARGFKRLKECGFIKVILQGGEFKGDKSVYELVDDWKEKQ